MSLRPFRPHCYAFMVEGGGFRVRAPGTILNKKQMFELAQMLTMIAGLGEDPDPKHDAREALRDGEKKHGSHR